jgi:hypothetical protein
MHHLTHEGNGMPLYLFIGLIQPGHQRGYEGFGWKCSNFIQNALQVILPQHHLQFFLYLPFLHIANSISVYEHNPARSTGTIKKAATPLRTWRLKHLVQEL